MVIVGIVRINIATGQKVITVPKSSATEEWVKGDYVELRKVKVKYIVE